MRNNVLSVGQVASAPVTADAQGNSDHLKSEDHRKKGQKKLDKRGQSGTKTPSESKPDMKDKAKGKAKREQVAALSEKIANIAVTADDAGSTSEQPPSAANDGRIKPKTGGRQQRKASSKAVPAKADDSSSLGTSSGGAPTSGEKNGKGATKTKSGGNSKPKKVSSGKAVKPSTAP